MKIKILSLIICSISISIASAQNIKKTSKEDLRRTFSQAACNCMDSIDFSTKS